jgi:MFS family permease
MLYSPSFITMALANLFTVCSIGAFFLFPLFITSHGGSKADIGVIMGIASLTSVLCRPWIAEMIDRIGRKRSYTIGTLVLSVLPLAYLLFRGDVSRFYLFLIVVRIIHGLGLAICFTAAFTYIADIIPPTRLNEGIGMFGITGLLGLGFGPAIGEKIIHMFGFSIFFVAISAMAALGLLLHLPLSESYVHRPGQSRQSFFSVLVRKRTLIVVLLAFLFGFGLSASASFVSPFAQKQNLTFISLYFICYSMSAVLARVLGGRIADKVGENRVIPYALMVTGSGLFMLAFLGGNVVLSLSGIMSGFGHGFLYPCLNAYAIRNEPIEIRGKITGVFTGGIDAGIFLGSLTLGFIGELAGFRVLFVAAGFALILGLCVYGFQERH